MKAAAVVALAVAWWLWAGYRRQVEFERAMHFAARDAANRVRSRLDTFELITGGRA